MDINHAPTSVQTGERWFTSYDNINQLPVDRNSRLSHHTLLVRHDCAGGLKLSSREAFEKMFPMLHPGLVTGALAETLLPGSCPAIGCFEIGMQLGLVSSETIERDVNLTNKEYTAWVEKNCATAEIGFINFLNTPVDVFWINPETQAYYPQHTLPPNCEIGA